MVHNHFYMHCENKQNNQPNNNQEQDTASWYTITFTCTVKTTNQTNPTTTKNKIQHHGTQSLLHAHQTNVIKHQVTQTVILEDSGLNATCPMSSCWFDTNRSTAETPGESSPVATGNSQSVTSSNGHSPSPSSTAGELGDSVADISSPGSR